MAKRLWVYVSKTDARESYATCGEAADANARADATLGLANWTAYDVTDRLRASVAEIANLARERQATRDGTGRWRWRTVSSVVKRWLGEPTEELCETCGNRWPDAA